MIASQHRGHMYAVSKLVSMINKSNGVNTVDIFNTETLKKRGRDRYPLGLHASKVFQHC